MNKIKLAALKHFEAIKARAEANLEIYLKKSVGIGEHPDVVEEDGVLIARRTVSSRTTNTVKKSWREQVKRLDGDAR